MDSQIKSSRQVKRPAGTNRRVSLLMHEATLTGETEGKTRRVSLHALGSEQSPARRLPQPGGPRLISKWDFVVRIFSGTSGLLSASRR